MARPALIYHAAALLAAALLAAAGWAPAGLTLAYLIQPIEMAWGVLHPAVGVKPKVIGIRQLIVSVIFTLTFILAW